LFREKLSDKLRQCHETACQVALLVAKTIRA